MVKPALRKSWHFAVLERVNKMTDRQNFQPPAGTVDNPGAVRSSFLKKCRYMYSRAVPFRIQNFGFRAIRMPACAAKRQLEVRYYQWD
jgi:hypothetical protein